MAHVAWLHSGKRSTHLRSKVVPPLCMHKAEGNHEEIPHTLKVTKRRRYHCSFVPQQRDSHNSAGYRRVPGGEQSWPEEGTVLSRFQAFCPHQRECETKQQKYRSLLSTVTRVDAWRFEHTERRGRYPFVPSHRQKRRPQKSALSEAALL